MNFTEKKLPKVLNATGKQLLKKLKSDLCCWIATVNGQTLIEYEESHKWTVKFFDFENNKIDWNKLWNWLMYDSTTMMEVINMLEFFGDYAGDHFFGYIWKIAHRETLVIDQDTFTYVRWLMLVDIYQMSNSADFS